MLVPSSGSSSGSYPKVAGSSPAPAMKKALSERLFVSKITGSSTRTHNLQVMSLITWLSKKFMIAAMNPLDRIDIHIQVPRVDYKKLSGDWMEGRTN